MSSDLLVEDRDAVRILMINRPARRNALTPDTVDELRALNEASGQRTSAMAAGIR